jgi:gamma-glutamylputrescine oxidase
LLDEVRMKETMIQPKQQVYWYTLLQPHSIALDKNLQADLIIVGGGMAGLMAAGQALKRGLKTVVLESQFCGAGASGKSSGFITPDSELELSDLLSDYGPKCAKELWEFVTSGCEAIRRSIQELNISCGYQEQDSLFIANSKRGARKIKQEHNARQSLNYNSDFYTREALPSIIGSTGFYAGVSYSGTFGINSYLYCQQLKQRLQQQGVQIYEHSPALTFDKHTVHTPGGSVTASKIFFCTDRFLPELGIVPKDIYHAQTFLSLSKPLTTEQIKEMFPKQSLMVWDTDLIYQYFRLTSENRLLLGGASLVYTYLKKEKQSPNLVIKKLNNYLASKFPQVKIELEYLWPGLIGVSKDFLPVAGQHQQWSHVYYAGGAAGLPWAAALGIYLVDKITTGRNELDKYFITPRHYPVSYPVQKILGKRLTFALSHGITKYLK